MKAIIMTTESVRAILDGHKTQTRRVIKPQPHDVPEGAYIDPYNGMYDRFTVWAKDNRMCLGCGGNIKDMAHWKPPYMPGDALWVRETWLEVSNPELKDANGYYYKATIAESVGKWIKELGCKWRSPIHMPRAAARIFLRVTGVRVERVLEISKADAIAEGVTSTRERVGLKRCVKENPLAFGVHRCPDGCNCCNARENYAGVWNSLNAHRDKGAYAWEKNPYVWVYDFERIEAHK